MKKLFLILLLTLSAIAASEPSTKEDIKELKEAIQRELDKRFGLVDKRFEQVDKRFEQMQAQMNTTNEYILGLLVGIFGLIGFMMWDRRTVSEKVKRETLEVVKSFDEKLSKKADKELFEKIVEVIERIAKDDKEAQEILKKHRLNFA